MTLFMNTLALINFDLIKRTVGLGTATVSAGAGHFQDATTTRLGLSWAAPVAAAAVAASAASAASAAPAALPSASSC